MDGSAGGFDPVVVDPEYRQKSITAWIVCVAVATGAVVDLSMMFALPQEDFSISVALVVLNVQQV